MNGSPFSRLRTRLRLLVLLAIVPLVGLMLYTAAEQRKLAIERVQENNLRVARLAALNIEKWIEGMRQQLYTLAESPDVIARDVGTCNELFARLRKQHAFCENLGAADASGTVFASALPFDETVTLADRPWFQRAMRTRTFSEGDYQVGRITGVPTINFAHPILGDEGDPTGVVFAALSLRLFDELARQIALPQGGTLLVVDRDGVVLARYPEPERWRGRRFATTEVVRAVTGNFEGRVEAEGLDGLRRLYGFTSLRRFGDLGMSVAVGVTRWDAAAEARRVFLWSLVVMGVMILLALIGARVFSDRFILRGLDSLVAATRQIEAGDLSARANVPGGPAELTELARAFNQMGQAIEQRDQDRREAAEALRQNEGRFRVLSASSPLGIFLTDSDGQCTYVNPRFRQILGLGLMESIGQGWLQCVGPASRDRVAEEWYSCLGSGAEYSNELRVHASDGQVRWIHVRAAKMLADDGRPLGYVGTLEDVSDRKRHEAALRESEEQYRTLVETAQDVIFTLSPGGAIESLNPSFQTLTGWPRERWLGQSFTPLVHPEDLPTAMAMLETVVRGQPTPVFELRIVARSGAYLFVELTAVPRQKDDAVVSVLSIARNVTERKQAEMAVAAAEAKYRNLIEQSADGILVADSQWNIQFANPAICEMLGYRPEELQQLNDLQTYRPEDRESAIQRWQTVGETTIVRFEREVVRKDGTRFPAEVILRRMKEGWFQGIIRDITERKQAEHRLLLQSAALQSAANAIVITDRGGQIQWVNPAFAKLTGYEPSEVIGQSSRLLRSGSHDKTFYQTLWQTILAGQVWHGEVINKRKDSTLYTEEMTITPVRDANGAITHFVAVKEDITDRKSLEAQLRQAQKMEAIGQLAGGVAHDFNNLLAAIIGFGELSLKKLDQPHPLYRNIQQIIEAGERAAGLTRQLLAFSRKQLLEPKVLDLNAVVPNLEKMLRRLIGEHIEFVVRCDPDLGRVKADPGQIEQVIMNLCVNARDAMPDGGTITLQTACAALNADAARRLGDIPPGEYVTLAVRDTGTGMTDEVKARLFEPFFTTKPQGKGTGLGLATVYGIVKQSGGHIAVESELGKGTTFTVYLPCVADPAEAIVRSGEGPLLPRGRETLLLVEDEAALREMAGLVLRDLGYDVLDAADGEAALRLALRHRGEIQLLITDVVMPRMSGKELADHLRRERPDARVLFSSGYTEDAILPHGVLAPGIAFLQKPFLSSALARKVREVLDAGNGNGTKHGPV